jgi:outer membrane protein insertion porin family
MKQVVFILGVSLLVPGAVHPAHGAAAQEAPAPNAVPAREVVATAKPAEIIKSLEFEGNRKFKDHVLRERLGFELGERLDPFLAEGGRQTIIEVYRKIGYPFVAVTLDRSLLADGHLLYRIEEGPRVQIASIEFVGNKAFRAGTLKQVIKLRQKKWLLWPSYYTEEAVETDAERLRDFYYSRGYLNYKIRSETKFSADRAKVHVTFFVEEGPLYHVADILLTGNTRFPIEKLRSKIPLHPGDVYLQVQADRGAREISQVYREQGFIDARVHQTPKFTAQNDEPLVVVEYGITEGKQFRIGQIRVTGNEVSKDKVVRRVLDEYGFTPGTLYNGKLAPKEGSGLLEKYVQRSAMAQQVTIRPVNPPAGQSRPEAETEARPPEAPTGPPAPLQNRRTDGEPNVQGPVPEEPLSSKDVQVDIEEGMTGMVRPGVGFSSDYGVIGQLIYQQRNFDISDLPEDLDEWFHPWRAFRGAGQTLSIALEPGTRYSQYYVDFLDPYWRDLPVSLDVSGRLWERFRECYDEKRAKGAFEFEQRLANNWRHSLGARVEDVAEENVDFDAPEEIKEWKGHTSLFGVRLGLGLIDLDDRYDPTTGQTLNAFYEQVTGGATFGILEGTYVHYWPLYEDVLGRKTVLAAKVLAGVVIGDAPPFEKFYAGGTGHYGFRGFEYRGISPRGLQTNVPNPRPDCPIGSDWIFLAGAEITTPLVGENFRGLFFLDSGTVDTGRYRLSVGTGLEIRVPQIFGPAPMRFEIGFPLLKDDQDETQIFSFSGGGLF